MKARNRENNASYTHAYLNRNGTRLKLHTLRARRIYVFAAAAAARDFYLVAIGCSGVFFSFFVRFCIRLFNHARTHICTLILHSLGAKMHSQKA